MPPRERFVLPRDNIPNKRRKQLREQFMRRTRLVIKESVSQNLPCLVDEKMKENGGKIVSFLCCVMLMLIWVLVIVLKGA